MTKHAKKSDHLQLVDQPKTTTVEIPLPLLGAFANIERTFFELCVDAGQQVLASMMEQDRDDLCGPRWKRDPKRTAGLAIRVPLPTGTTEVFPILLHHRGQDLLACVDTQIEKRSLDVRERSQQRERDLHRRRLRAFDELEMVGLLGMLGHGGGSFVV